MRSRSLVPLLIFAMTLATIRAATPPQINGARVFGVRPGSTFLFTVAATGDTPLRYEAEQLPAGLQIDATTGSITGVIRDRTPETYHVRLRVSNGSGQAERELRIVVGDKICLTPPMGWNSWNSWATAVDEKKVRATAEAMAKLLKGHGWTYVNIDDSWQGQRGGPLHSIQPNAKFGDMQELAAYVHSLGLKLGLYSTPWMTSYAGYVGGSSNDPAGAWSVPKNAAEKTAGWRIGKYNFEQADAQQWAEWGIDYVKYDWEPNDVPATERMSDALRAQSRDIVLSLSNTARKESAADYTRLANAFRTTGDIRDMWDNGTNDQRGLKGIADIARLQEQWAAFAGPGHWPDPDMLVVGRVGWGPQLHPSRLTPDEQHTHISLWCLWSAPLLIGCPIEQLDDFTLGLLTNDEVIEVDQDPLGEMARTVASDGLRHVLMKHMEDGRLAVGLFNGGAAPADVRATWSALGITGKHRVRDLWRHADVGDFTNEFTASVPAHGLMLIMVSP